MKPQHKYIKKETKGQIIFIIAILLAIIIGLVWNMAEENNRAPAWQTEHPMPNAQVSWLQTHHEGPWGGQNDGH